MTSYVFPPEAPVTLAVTGSDALFPVRRVYCVGRNYAAHAREMGFSDREPPFFFCKPAGSVVPVAYGEPVKLEYPTETSDYHYEAELVAVIGKGGASISKESALDHVYGYAVGLDMTRRDLQKLAREAGRPWETGKAFDRAAPIGPIHPVSQAGHVKQANIWLKVNGEEKQNSDVNLMIWDVAETISYLSRFFRLEPGDVIMTGTPEGVGPVKAGDTITMGVEGLGLISAEIV